MSDFKPSPDDWTNTKGLSGVLNITQDAPKPGPIEHFVVPDMNDVGAELQTYIHVPTDVTQQDVLVSSELEGKDVSGLKDLGILTVTINRNSKKTPKHLVSTVVSKLQVTLWFNQKACDVPGTTMCVQPGKIILTTPRHPESLEAAQCEIA